MFGYCSEGSEQIREGVLKLLAKQIQRPSAALVPEVADHREIISAVFPDFLCNAGTTQGTPAVDPGSPDRDPEEVKKGLDQVRGALLESKREMYFTSWIQDAQKKMQDAKSIKINQATLTQLVDTAR
jgi:hypothetical protein